VRRIDWNVTARLGAPFVRRTHAERELNLVVAIDVSRSMELGTSSRSKRETMLLVTASLVFSALATQVNTGFLAFSDRVVVSRPPRRRRAAAWAMLEQCWSVAGGSRTAILPAVRYLLSTLKQMSVVCVVSDFETDEDLFGAPELAMLASRHDVVAIVPEDSFERELPPGPGFVRVRDLESGRTAPIDLGKASRRRFAGEAAARRQALARACYRASIEPVFVPTDGNPLESLMGLFASRLRR
jgi:uncharacterized protein (DUF58 family)